MNFISKIYKKLLTLFNNKSVKQPKNIVDFINESSVLFSLYNNCDIVTLVNVPDTSNCEIDELTLKAENYANFIVHITNGLIYDQIINLLNNKIKTSENINNKLFLENVLYFIPLLEKDLENKLLYNLKTNDPMISPLNVFRK